ncbi:MAG: hypothetical protein GTO45_29370 [Candidatus Aminicenantes bacterium]|nr:hypothetical protein [Candidatus Aminicenantes bacterium]NIM82904.1 hypothetical protein [Candidatus Aminicenantes bacterium]NIN22280.1 hypothetical protein [Candidatus Aminicenantes bacterium]NIN46048.1 hypothetical protein [Candidatus Aminicenantes bacterium]NIN88884.1 hypothetical protein [Candidatus Aminicenantes bacterium]
MFNEIVYVCDLCGGSPKCIEACTEKAITYKPELKNNISLETLKKETKTMNPGEKRAYYIGKVGSWQLAVGKEEEKKTVSQYVSESVSQ